MSESPATGTQRQPGARVPPARRLVTVVLWLATTALILNVLVGTRGLPAVLEARRQLTDASDALEQVRQENARLRAEIQRLRTDPAAIEELARRDLGLVRPGEKVFIIREAAPAPR
jgi:cell division protein FtsB